MLHLSALIDSPDFKKKQSYFLIPHSVADRLQNEYGWTDEFRNSICPEAIVHDGKYRKLLQCFQAIRVARKNNCDAICFKYLDDHLFVMPITKLLIPGVHISGIFFRPVLHYYKESYPREGIPFLYWGLMILKNLVLWSFLRLGILNTCFFQDEGAINTFSGAVGKAVWIPTPINDRDTMSPIADFNSSGLTFLFFGQIAQRKGIYRVFAAWRELPHSLKPKIKLQIIGRSHPEEKEKIHKDVRDLIKDGWDVIHDDRFVLNDEIRDIFRDAHIVLSPHDLQFGTSGVTVQSSVWRRPMIVHDLGWVGKTVKKYKLGLAFNTADPKLFAARIVEIAQKKKILAIPQKTALAILTIHDRNNCCKQIFTGLSWWTK